jgi:hypothetical protein
VTLLATLAACASVQEPPGGPPDFTPPTLVTVRPDSGAVLERLDDPVEFQFDEVITEPTGAAAARLFFVSPRVEELEVGWKRTRLTVRPRGGWRRGVVYRLALLPAVTDLRSNRLTAGRDIVFAVGTTISETRLTGMVVDWEAARSGRGALVDAVSLPDSTTYVTQADSTGAFDLWPLPPGVYTVFATVDANGNRVRDRGEPFDTATIVVDSSAHRVFWAFRQDTVGPLIRALARADSATIRVDFTQAVPPGPVEPGAILVLALPDSSVVPVHAVWRQAEYDSARAEERRLAAAVDTLAAADTLAADTAAAARPARPPRAAPPDSQPPPADAAAAELLRQRPPLSDRLFVRVEADLAPGTRWVVLTRLANLLGYAADGRSVLVVPGGEAPP